MGKKAAFIATCLTAGSIIFGAAPAHAQAVCVNQLTVTYTEVCVFVQEGDVKAGVGVYDHPNADPHDGVLVGVCIPIGWHPQICE